MNYHIKYGLSQGRKDEYGVIIASFTHKHHRDSCLKFLRELHVDSVFESEDFEEGPGHDAKRK